MKLVSLATQSYEDVPEDQVQKALADGTHGFDSPDALVPMRGPDGTLGQVKAADYQQAVQAGAQVVPQAEYHQAEVEQRHSGLGSSLAALGEGVARGATVGLADPIAIKVASLFGPEAEAKVRTHLAEEKEAHPYLAGAGEIAGAAAPMLLTGGASAAVEGTAAVAEGAEAASEGGRIATLLKAVGAPARAVGRAGEGAASLAETATNAVMGAPGAEGAIARITRAALKSGVQMGTEGALFGAGQEISEDALGDHQLNAEKLLAAMGHGAVYGAMIGAGTGAVGAGVKALLPGVMNRVAPQLEKQADIQAFRAFDPKLGVVKEAEARAGGAEALGRVARDYGIIPDSPVEAMKLGPEQLLARTRQALDTAGQKIDGIIQGSSATVKASEILAPLDARIQEVSGTAAGKPVARTLQTFRDDLAQSLGIGEPAMPPPAAPAAQRVARTPQEIQEYLAEHPDIPAFDASGKLSDEVAFHPAAPAAPPVAPPAADPEVPIAKLVAERRSLQTRLYEDQKTLSPKWPLKEMRQFTGELNDLEEKAINTAAHDLGTEQGTALRNANKDYQRLSILREAAERRMAAHTALRAVSPTSYLAGGAVGAGMLAHGNVVGAAGGIASALGHQAILERGNAVAAAALGRIAKLDLIARAAEKVDGEIDGALTKFATSSESRMAPKIRLRHFGGPSVQEDPQERLRQVTATVPTAPPTLTPQHADKVAPEMSAHAPKTAAALTAAASRGAAYLNAQTPAVSSAPSVLAQQRRPTDQQASDYVRIHAAVDDPIGTVKRGLETGKVHADEMQAIAATKPKLYAEIQQKALDTIAEHRDEMTFDKVQTLSKVIGTPLDPALTPQAVAAMQQTWAQQNTQAQAPKAPKRQVTGFSDQATLSTGIVDASR